ncbi:MAG: type IV pilus secretin family protein, partial [Acidobacteria bacterium]
MRMRGPHTCGMEASTMRTIAIEMNKWGKWRSWAAFGGAALALLLGACSASSPPETSSESSVRVGVETPIVETTASPAVEIYSLDLREAAPGAQLEVDTSGSLVWTTYRDGDDHLVVELPNSQPAVGVNDLFVDDGLVESVMITTDDSDERPLTRLVVRTRAEAEHSVEADGTRLLVGIAPVDDEWRVAEVDELESDSPAVDDTVVAEESISIGEEAAVAAAATAAPGEPETTPGPMPEGVPASQLQNVEVSIADQQTMVKVLGDGEFYYSTFTLQAPERFVIDLIGVVNTAPLSTISGDGGLVDQVRVAQFKPQPELVSRVVVDLSSPAAAQVERLPDGLVLTFEAADSTTLVQDVSSGWTTREEEPIAEVEPTWAESFESDSEGMGSAENDAVGAHGLPAVAVTAQIQQDDVGAGTAGQPVVEDEVPSFAPTTTAEDPAGSTDLFAADVGAAPATRSSDTGSGTVFEEQEVGDTGERTYHGEPMTMSLKDADIKDVLRSFAQISGLNVVVQPGVRGSVTVELTNVPWDQALEQILKINGLGYELEGNIMRIAPINTLRTEAEAKRQLAAAQALSIPLSTIIKKVSYAPAGSMAGLLQRSVMSQRGAVIVDARTNTLIIKELPAYMKTVIAIIETLDTPEPQVQIESRIIETTKNFSRTLGIEWGFLGVADTEHGNTTGLMFPNSGEVEGSVNLLTGGANGLLDITMGNVLDTFTLDITLQAAEDEGLVNILSAPRVTTLNNQQASIQSGLQIPIQTVANNTVSVQFVNATLRLDVTPHVTAEGTVLLDINIQKREPLLAFAVVGATNAPISTKDAKTRVMVRDGGTTVIGGIYKVTEDRGEDRVPGL